MLVIAEIIDKEHFLKIVVGKTSNLQYAEYKKCRMLLTCVLENEEIHQT